MRSCSVAMTGTASATAHQVPIAATAATTAIGMAKASTHVMTLRPLSIRRSRARRAGLGRPSARKRSDPVNGATRGTIAPVMVASSCWCSAEAVAVIPPRYS